MSPSDYSHINILNDSFWSGGDWITAHTEFPWCTVHTAIAEDPVRFREGYYLQVEATFQLSKQIAMLIPLNRLEV
jgi:hypothetical protein